MFNRWSPAFTADQVRSRKRLEDEGLHEELEERFRKTLYYGELPDDDDCPSLPLTNLAVDFFQGATPRGLGQVNMSVASSLAQDAYVSPGSLVTSMIYAKRLRHRNPDYLQKMSSSDLFFISVMMASKYMYDEGVDEEVFNDEWAEAANLEVDEVNQMERDFLSAMDWQLFVSQSEFLKAVQALERRIAWTQGCDRGWMSYTDMDVLWHDQLIKRLWEDIAKEWLKVVTVSSAAYVTGVLTMVGSTALALQLSTAMVGCVMLSQPHFEQPIPSQPHFEQPIQPQPHFEQSVMSQPRSNEPVLTADSLMDQLISTRSRFDTPSNLPALPWNETLTANFSESHVQGTNETSHPTLLEKVLPQLWAVVAFKDRFVHLICAFSEGLKHISFGENLRTVPKKCTFCSRRNRHHKTDDESVGSVNSDNDHAQCRACPQCSSNDQSTNLKSCPVPLSGDDDPSALDLNRLKSNLNFDPWCSHGNRPPDSAELNLGMLQYPDVVRGFTTSVPVAA